MLTREVRYAAAVVLIAGCSSVPRVPSTLDYSQYRAIAVLPFRTEGFLERYGAEVADQVIIEIISRDPTFPVVERAEIEQLLLERGMWANDLHASKLPTLLHADLILTGSAALAVASVDRPGPIRQARLTATVRAIDTASGRIVWAGRFSASGEDLLIYETDGTPYRYQSDAEIREQAIRKLAEQIVRGLLGRR